MANKESGFPTNKQDFSTGSTEFSKNFVALPSGFTTTAPTAVLSPHQESGDTRPIGIPGTDYTPHTNDHVVRTPQGHMIVYGHAPGDETMRIHPVTGGALEFSKNGIKISSTSGLHFSINSDGQFVFAGDVNFSTSGAFKIKCGSFVVDCADYTKIVAGDEIVNVQGNSSRSIDGDNQTKTLGDTSSMTAGDVTTIAAGNYKQVISGNVTMGNLGSFSMSSKGNASFGTQGNMSMTTQGNATVNTKGNFTSSTTGDSTTNTKGKATIASSGDMSVSTQGAQAISAKGSQTVTSSGGTTVASSGSATVSGSSTAIHGASGIALNGAGVTSSTPVTTGGGGTAPTVTEPTAPEVPEAKVKVDVPETKQIIEQMGDYVQTDGEIDKIYTMSQLEEAYDVEDGGKIPDKVMARAKELGIADNYKPSPPETASGSGGVHYGGNYNGSFNVG